MKRRGRCRTGILAGLLLLAALPAVVARAEGAAAPATGAKPAARPTKRFKVDAEKWAWTPDTITVKRGTHVVLELTSGDASRAFELKDYNVKVSVPEGETARAEFDADRVGTFSWRCSRPCGDGCAKLKGKLVVEE